MKNQNKNINAISNKSIEKKDPMPHFKKKVLRHSALASNNISNLAFDIDDAMNQSQLMIQALNAQDGLQEMVAAEIISTHRLQQLSMSLANAADEMYHKQYFTNAAIKLANCFVQQANLLSRLQGSGGQRITIERVDVYQGGQAIVGNISDGGGGDKKMKTTSCTESTTYAFNNAPRCGARTKRNNGNPCKAPAVRGKQRCRIHGGSKSSGGQQKNRNALKHGYTTAEVKGFRVDVSNALKATKALKEFTVSNEDNQDLQ